MTTNPAARPRELFGTDGIRGIAGQFPLDRPTVLTIGRAVGAWLREHGATPRVLIGEDTRESSDWIGRALAAGLTAAGIEVAGAGIITTPGVAFLARTQGFSAGIVVSASHNPWQDNGIKIFGADGFKLSDDIEHAIERRIFADLEARVGQPSSAGRVDDGSLPDRLPYSPELHAGYVRWLASSAAGVDLRHLKLIADCANGATSMLAPELFAALGVEACFLNIEPDGRNINAGSGALHPEVVAQAVKESRTPVDLGVSFDGDGDRVLFADAEGQVVNGDAVLLLAARAMRRRGTLRNSTVVATTMSNMGLEAALGRDGIRMLRAPVGDKYVLEEMVRTGATLGGEQSGHIIFRDGESTTGDGLLTALRVLTVMAASGQPLAELIGDLRVFPQTIKNIRVREKRPFSELPQVQHAIEAAERELGGDGRIVVRYSGTEALARVMVEAASEEQMQRIAEEVAGAIQKELGA